MPLPTLPPEDIERILKYLSSPPSRTLSSDPLTFLSTHLPILPTSLLLPFSPIIPPRQRSSIPLIKSRRLLYASSTPPPTILTARSGRLRWPLLWERLGGSSLPPPSAEVVEEEDWVEQGFMPGKEGRQHVKKLGGFLRGLEEERELEGVREARRVERRLDDLGEEFDEESDEDGELEGETILDGNGNGTLDGRTLGVNGYPGEVDQEEVKVAFERKLLELFVDGLDVSSFSLP